ncbi:TPA: hypothetical protein I8Y21_002235 [Klebsiella oxytoca]|uniref:Uncharacterized protein n=1 Tax=Klebsiella oxytoca TaxID=571 RepID=A0AAN5RDP1_KLEOX|nr:hypothetical protein [Klebsiella oxytoca]
MEVLKLIEQSSILRKMFYAVLVVLLVWGAGGLPGLALLIKAVRGL